MLPPKARVHNGRLLLDEPNDLPDGEVVELIPAAEVGAELDDEERERLHASLRESIEQMKGATRSTGRRPSCHE